MSEQKERIRDLLACLKYQYPAGISTFGMCPAHERVTDRSRLLSGDERDAKRTKNREQVAKMKEALRGRA